MLDLLIVLVIGVLVASRFFKFKLPGDTRSKAERKADYERLFKRPAEVQRPAESPEHEAPKTARPSAEVVALPVKSKNKAKVARAAGAEDLPGLAALQEADPNFDTEAFGEGVVAAYKYFQECYAAKDVEGLDNLCGPKLLAELEAELESEAFAPVRVEAVQPPKLLAARLNGRTAVVEVEVPATVRPVDAQGGPRQVRDRWVLARALGSADPNWELQSLQRGRDA